MSELELHRLFLLAFHRSNRAIVTQTCRFPLLPGQPKILDFLWGREGCTQREIGQGCALDKSTVTGLLARMEEQELIRRDTQDTDRRISRVFLTDEGRKQAQRVRQVCAQVDEQAWRGISERDRQRTVAVLEHILQNLEEVKKS